MNIFKVADGLVLKVDQDEWRLVADRSDGLTLFTVTAADRTVRYRPEFARARRLPPDGELSASYVQEVVVGWSQEDHTWHLGLLLVPSLAETRGGRWCQLACWPFGAVQDTRAEAREAGESLAHALGKRFRFVDAPAGAAVSPSVEPASISPVADTQPVQLRQEALTPPRVARPIELPLDLGDWQLRKIDIGMQWEHKGVWVLGTLWSIFGRIVLGSAFIFLSVLTLRSPYATVQPSVLPYVGLVIGIGLIIAAVLYTVRRLREEVVVLDEDERQVRRHLDLTSDILETYEFEEIAAVVATQIAQGGRQRGSNGEPDHMAHEGWLHLLLQEPRQIPGKERNLKPEDAYVTIGYIDGTEGDVVDGHFSGTRKQRRPALLHEHEATTPVLQAAVALAQMIGVDAYVDQR